MINLIRILLLFTFVYMNESERINNYNLESMSLKDKIAQMIMVRINGEFYNTEHWRKKKVVSLIYDSGYNPTYKDLNSVKKYINSVYETSNNIGQLQEIYHY